MENAKILHIEDNTYFIDVVKTSLNLDQQGHSVVEIANNMENARESLYRLARNELDFNVVLLDSNLSGESTKGADAKRIIQIIKELKLELITIGCSEDNLKINSVDVDFELPKQDFGTDKLIALINSI